VFFVLSGFLITSLLIGEWDRWSSVSYRNFYARRALRLLPALALVLGTVSAAVLLIDRLGRFRKPTLSHLPWAVFYVGNYNFHDLGVTNLIAQTWSLAIEEQFYLLWPVVCVAILRRRFRRQWVAVALASLSLVEMICRFVYIKAGGWQARSYHSLDLRSDGLLMGCAVAFLLASPWAIPAMGGRLRTGGQVGSVLGVIAIAIIATGPSALLEQWLAFPVAVLGTTLVLWNQLTHPLRGLSQVLSWRPITWVGQVSYGLYLIHWPLFRILDTVPGNRYVLDTVGFLMSFVLAALSYELLEKRTLLLKKHFQRTEAGLAMPRQ
jgi:peptidoglycan/LPS O-acetylase OafA/YrhL